MSKTGFFATLATALASALLPACDAVNLHPFGDTSLEAIHATQVAEHWKPHLVPHILREFWRVTRPGGLFFCCLNTEELFARQGRGSASNDTTHACVRPRRWWHQQLQGAGWRPCSEEFATGMHDHPLSFLKRYDWDWWVARKEALP